MFMSPEEVISAVIDSTLPEIPERLDRIAEALERIAAALEETERVDAAA